MYDLTDEIRDEIDECGQCGGSGEVQSDEIAGEWQECPTCLGTGEAQPVGRVAWPPAG